MKEGLWGGARARWTLRIVAFGTGCAGAAKASDVHPRASSKTTGLAMSNEVPEILQIRQADGSWVSDSSGEGSDSDRSCPPLQARSCEQHSPTATLWMAGPRITAPANKTAPHTGLHFLIVEQEGMSPSGMPRNQSD
jgi:hypothetical protein